MELNSEILDTETLRMSYKSNKKYQHIYSQILSFQNVHADVDVSVARLFNLFCSDRSHARPRYRALNSIELTTDYTSRFESGMPRYSPVEGYLEVLVFPFIHTIF